jgi:type I restriction enzyme M protein
VVANPPFSDKRWSTGLDPENDEYDRFGDYGTPPDKNGDYAYLLHIIRSLKSRGKGPVFCLTVFSSGEMLKQSFERT